VAPSSLVLADGVHVTAILLTPGSPGNSGAGYDVIGPARPVKAGETLVVYGVGFGPARTLVAAGSAYADATSTTNPVSVATGGAARKTRTPTTIGTARIGAAVSPSGWECRGQFPARPHERLIWPAKPA